VLSVGVAEGDVDAGKFFVLQNVTDDAGNADVGADGEFAHAIGVFIGVGVGPEIPLELLVRAGAGHDAIFRDLDGEGRFADEAVACAEPIANYAIDYKGAVYFAGRGEAFTAGEIAPLLRRDDARGFEPLVVGVHVRDDAGACGSSGTNTGGAADAVQNLLAKAVDLIVVCAHAVAHDFGGDVDHVGMTHAAAIDDVGHLHAGMEFVGLHLHSEDGDLRSLHVFKHRRGHIPERSWGDVFEDEGVKGAAAFGELRSDRGGDGLGDAVGDERNLFIGLDAQAGGDGGAGARDELSRVGLRQQVRGGCGKACDDGAPSDGDARGAYLIRVTKITRADASGVPGAVPNVGSSCSNLDVGQGCVWPHIWLSCCFCVSSKRFSSALRSSGVVGDGQIVKSLSASRAGCPRRDMRAS